MPVLNVGRVVFDNHREMVNHGESNLSLFLSGTKVQSIMGWPNDSEMRDNYVASRLAELIGFNDKRSSEMGVEAKRDWQKHRELFINMLEECGGLSRVAEAPSRLTFDNHFGREVVGKWAVAGYILGIVKRISIHHNDIEASINKAVEVLECIPANSPMKKTLMLANNSRYIRSFWEEYRSVAHLCKSFIDHFMFITRDSDDDEDESSVEDITKYLDSLFNNQLWRLLYLAKHDYEFGTNFELPRRKGERLLDPDSTWQIVYDPHGLGFSVTTHPLDGSWLETARAYRAPKRL